MGRYPGEQDSEPWEDPQHAVTFAEGFWMGKHEVTIAQYMAFLHATGDESGVDWGDIDCPIERIGTNYVLQRNPFGRDKNQPMVEVTWHGAAAFAAWVAAITGEPYRLPSEAEWEYACRAGATTRFHWGDDPNYVAIDDYAWYTENSANQTQQVGLKLPNGWGLFDMSGNVWEWCQDSYRPSYAGAPVDGRAWETAATTLRVARGGGWFSYPDLCRSARRSGREPETTLYSIGFRLVR